MRIEKRCTLLTFAICLLFCLLKIFMQGNTTVNKRVLTGFNLASFCANLNDNTQLMLDYQTPHPEETDLFFASINSSSHRNCRRFRWAFMPQEESPVAAQEAAYPLAFTIVAHRNVRQLARLLRMIHRTANFYCIHIDRRSAPAFSRAVEGIATCFGSNVHVLHWFKGTVYGAYKRDFLDFALHSPATQPILKVIFSSKRLRNPEEFFFQTVAFNSHIRAPGACLRPSMSSEVLMGYPGRYVVWSHPMSFCPTKYVRSVCILGSPHVPELRRTFHLFANKMHADYYPEAYDCMERWYFMRLQREWALRHMDWKAFQPWAFRQLACS
ncbi:unnamed protein product [Dibothriocephalus latus]|uniref:Protein xylosyltransferase n=1 Tax=Dibothriocephalus latus TaxID=60516 RepID=A0A3P7M166_DIBLA|nr:unnamed protein product [Dibothriocephalus latus]